MMKVCTTIELKTPISGQICQLVKLLMPQLDVSLFDNMIEYISGDLRKINSLFEIYTSQQNILKNKIITNMFQPKTHNEDTKHITRHLLNKKYSINDHNLLMNQTDRTSVGLLFHENIIDLLDKMDKNKSIPFYIKFLRNITFADYTDRITFQKQIWIFNEMSSLLKTLYNNTLFHTTFKDDNIKFNSEVRFTKVLTKYSTEYNNMLFIQNLCRQLNMDKKDMFSFFIHLRQNHSDEEIQDLFNNENYEINKLDINRIYRFINRYTDMN